jgi:cell division septal protein FtsQ
METGVFAVTAKFLLKIGLLSGLVLGINYGLNYIHSVRIDQIKRNNKTRKERVYNDSNLDDLREKLAARG